MKATLTFFGAVTVTPLNQRDTRRAIVGRITDANGEIAAAVKSRLLIGLLCATAWAQPDPRGTLVGRVTDGSGAVVAGAKVRVTNVNTNVTLIGSTNEAGHYEIPYLLPGPYRVEGQLEGFKIWRSPAITIRTQERLQIDIALEIGNVNEVVEVAAETPVLETLTGSVSQVLSSRQAADLPLRGGSLAWLFQQTPGVVLPSLPGGGPWNVAQASDVSSGGTGARSFDFNIDGVSTNAYGGHIAFVPPPDMVQEVRVETASFDASVGHTLGGSVSISLKAGTNALHGSFGAWFSGGPMKARDFFTNRFIFDPTTGPITSEKIRANTPEDKWNRYVGTAGGPVVIPKVYDGRNRTFWQFGYQLHDRAEPNTSLVTVPTEAQRRGDFSALLALGSRYQIYDPMTTTPSGASRFARQPFANNIIPASRISASARNILRYYPGPNTAGTADGLENYSVRPPRTQVLKQPVARIDHNFSQKHRMFARYSRSDFTGTFDTFVPDSAVRGRLRRRPHRGLALDNVLVFSPQTLLDLRYGITWFQEWESFKNVGFNLAELGLSPSLIRQLDPEGISFPEIRVSGLLQLGNNGGFSEVNYTHSLLAVLSRVQGSHSFRFGSDSRLMFENSKNFGNISPRMDFAQTYTRGPLDNSPVAPAGQGLASLLLDIPTGGWADLNASRAQSSRLWSLFVQDDWRATGRLTLSLGFRWEYETPVTERFNRSSRQFDEATPNPIEAEARARYAAAPIPEVPVSQFRTRGGITFVGVGGNPRGIRNPSYLVLMPRFGFAYRWTTRSVWRGGYGIYYGLLGADFVDVLQPGFSQRTEIVPSLDNGLTYQASLANPLPFGLARPLGAAGGLETFLGRSPAFFNSDGRRPYSQRWSLSLQVAPLSQSVLEVGYLGTRSVRLRARTPLNVAPESLFSRSPERDQAAIDRLTAAVQNPFVGIAPFSGSALFRNVNTTRQQLLQPFPHFAAISDDRPTGYSWYHALLVRFERRFRNGFQVQGNYTWSKTMEAIEYLNDTDSRLHETVANLDRPHRVTLTGIYELPFGRGRRLGSGASGAVQHLIGGWQIQGNLIGQSGAPLRWGNVLYRGNYADIRLPVSERSPERWFRTDGFERDPRRQLGSNIRTFPLRVSGVRADGISEVDFGLIKEVPLRERIRLQIRADAEAVMNHPVFGSPNLDPSSTLFGSVSSAGGERRISVGAKVLF